MIKSVLALCVLFSQVAMGQASRSAPLQDLSPTQIAEKLVKLDLIFGSYYTIGLKSKVQYPARPMTVKFSIDQKGNLSYVFNRESVFAQFETDTLDCNTQMGKGWSLPRTVGFGPKSKTPGIENAYTGKLFAVRCNKEVRGESEKPPFIKLGITTDNKLVIEAIVAADENDVPTYLGVYSFPLE